jgi:signal transduction histidine kinase
MPTSSVVVESVSGSVPAPATPQDAIAQVGPLFWPFLVYADLVVWGCTALFVWTLTRLSRRYWRQSLLLIVTVLLPFLANILHNLNVGPFGRVELLDGLGATITDSLGRLRQLAFELHPPPLDRVGLAAALHQYARSVGELAGFRVRVEDHLTRKLPVELQEIAYRIAQEALANVRAHAGAKRVTIWLEDADDDGMRLRISDDGAGFLPGIGPAQPDPDHLSLVSMREQAVMAGGWCRVASAPGMGTVELWLPA